MDNKSSWSSCAFELEDIEIIDHKNGNEEKAEKKWHCDQCSLFFLEKGKLDEHKKKHNKKETVNCKYCDKIISVSEGNKASLVNRKCETCEYKCSKCPRRFLRHSSLVNHEKKHSSPKKKKDLCNNKKVNGVCPENGAVSKGVKRKLSEIDDSEEEIKALKKTKKILIVQKSQKKKLHSQVGTQAVSDNENPSIKSPKRLSTKEIKLEEKTNNCEDSPNKVNKRLSFKGDKQSNEKHSPVKSKLTAVNPQAVSTPPNVSSTSSENVVNYKPFSCHVCGDTFASDGALLGHIKTHGENAAKSFKCKFCGDEFDDIYKMQYHLAICPLAEDELESSLKQVLPVSKPMTFSAPPLSPRKRGRPKRLVESPSTEENESTQSPLNNRSVRKRRSVIPELNEMGQTTITSKQPRKSSNFQKSSVSGSNRVGGENVNDTLSSDITEVSKNNEPDDDRKKLHQCPFPRCDFKFTREKALLCHMRNHSDDFDDSLKCHKCDIPFEDIHALRLHINMCKGIKEEKDDDFNRAKSYDSSPNRTFQRAMKKDFVCNQCGRSYQSQEKLNSHECYGCESIPLVKKALRRHRCNVCKAEFQSEFEENNHMVAHSRKEEEGLCLRCYSYYKETPMLEHKCNNHVIRSVRTLIELSICQKNLTPKYLQQLFEESKLQKLTVNKRKRMIFCTICKLSFSSKKIYLKHCINHKKKKRVSCSHCNKFFFSQKKLKRHNCKKIEQPIKCCICSEEFFDRISLSEHLNKQHIKDMENFDCEHCRISVPDASSYIDHLMSHILSHPVGERFSENIDCKSCVDSSEVVREDLFCKLPGKEKYPSRKCARRTRFHQNLKLANFDKYKINYKNRFNGNMRLGQNCGSRTIEPSQALKCKDNIQPEESRNKEKHPENVVADGKENCVRKIKCSPNIKSCYVPLMNIQPELTGHTDKDSCQNSVVENTCEGKNKSTLLEEHFNISQLPLRRIKQEKDNYLVSSNLVYVKSSDNGGGKNMDTPQEMEVENKTRGECVGNSVDVDDSVVIVSDIKVHKCSICYDVFDSIESLRNHVIVHIHVIS